MSEMLQKYDEAAEPRFAFGANWAKFLESLNEARIIEAERSLQEMLDLESLQGLTFLDIGSGSGLFSLAARRLGASVRSFDYDPESVGCTAELRRRFFPEDPRWSVSQGSVLDEDFLARLGRFDVVYSWGVLHHTGAMWKAVENACDLVRPGGLLFIALYNDQGLRSRGWKFIKRTYNRLPRLLRPAISLPYGLLLWSAINARDLALARPLETWRRYHTKRGMSPWRDIVDWVGGYPFEVTKPDAVVTNLGRTGFVLTKLKTCGGKLGCNEFVLRRVTS